MMMDGDHSTNSDRLEYLYLNLVGQTVQILMVDGSITEGVFISRTDSETSEDKAGVFLSCTRFLQSQHHKPVDPAQFSPGSTLFLYKDMVSMDAVYLKIRTETPGRGHVNNYRGERDLKALDWAEDCADETLDKMEVGEWDQFKANERFGVKSSYNEDIYTTKLDRSKITKEQMDYADNIAKSIETAPVRGVQHEAERQEMMRSDLGEGELFSDVARDMKGKRGGYAAAAAAPPPRKADARAQQTSAKQRGAQDESAAAADNGVSQKDFNPNPAAAPFVPSRPIINDYLKSIAEAINANASCYMSEADWPGDEDRYKEEPMPPQPQAMMQPNFAPPPQQHHQHHQHNQHHHQHHQPHHHQQASYNNMHGYNNRQHGGHHVMQNQPPQFNNNQGYMNGPQQVFADPTSMPPMGGAGPSTTRMPPQQPQQQQQQGQRVSMKGSQPQQPVIAVPSQQQQQQGGAIPPHQHQQQQQQQNAAIPAVDSGSAIDKQQPAKKLRRGGGTAPVRAEADGPQGGKKGGK